MVKELLNIFLKKYNDVGEKFEHIFVNIFNYGEEIDDMELYNKFLDIYTIKNQEISIKFKETFKIDFDINELEKSEMNILIIHLSNENVNMEPELSIIIDQIDYMIEELNNIIKN